MRNQKSNLYNQRYRLLRRLGEGGMGSVLLVADQLGEEKAHLALKILRATSNRVEDLERAFRDEFRHLAELRHPGLAEVHDFGRLRSTGELFFTTDFVDGKDIFVATEKMSMQDRLRCLYRVAEALDYIHAKGVLHNDLKAANILVETATQQPKILDFGVSVGLLQETASGAGFRGTPAYAAPEKIRGEPPTVQSDVYALGILAYRILARKFPFPERSRDAIFQAHLDGGFSSLSEVAPEVPKEISALVMNMVARDPDERPAGCGEVAERLAELVPTLAAERGSGEALRLTEGQRLIGRELLLLRLRAWLLQALCHDGEGVTHVLDEDVSLEGLRGQQSVMLIGAPGIGKSALLLALQRECQLREQSLLMVTAVSQHALFSPWLRVMDEIELLESPPEAWKDVKTFFVADEKSETFDREGFFRRVLEGFQEAFSKRRFAVAIDDADFLDEASRQFLEYWLRRPLDGELPPLLLAGARDGLLASPRAGRDGRAHGETIAIAPLGSAEIVALLKTLLPGADLPERWTLAMAERSGGNPAFLREYARTLVASGLLARRGGRWERTSAPEKMPPLPESMANLFARRMSDLPEAERSIVELLAVAQETLTLHELGEILDLDRAVALVARLEAAQLVRRDSGDGLQLQQGALREWTVGALEDSRAKKRHEQCIVLFRARSKTPLAALAHHLAAAGFAEDAATTALRAALEARRYFAESQAASLYQMAWEQAEGQKDSHKLAVQARLGWADVLWRTGRHAEARGHYTWVKQHAETDDLTEERAKAQRAEALYLLQTGKHREAIEAFEVAVTAWGRKGAPERAELYAQESLAWQRDGQAEKAEEFRERALSLVRRGEEWTGAALPVLLLLAPAELRAKRMDSAQRLCEQSLALARRLNDRRAEAASLTNLASLAALRGDSQKARDDLLQNVEVCRAIHDAVRLCRCLSSLGKACFLLTEYPQAAEHLQEALRLARGFDDRSEEASIRLALAQLEIERSHFRLAADDLAEASSIYKSLRNRRGQRMAQVTDVVRLLSVGCFKEGLDLLESLESGDAVWPSFEATLRVRLLLKLNQPDRAEEVLNQTWKEGAEGLGVDDQVGFELLRADLQLARGTPEAARPPLRAAANALGALNDRVLRLRHAALSLEVMLRTEDRSDRSMRTRLREATESLQNLDHPYLQWQFAWLSARVARQEGAEEEVVRQMRLAEEILQQVGSGLSESERTAYFEDPERRLFTSELQQLMGSQGFRDQQLADLQKKNERLHRLLEINQQLAAGWKDRTRLLDYILDVALEVTEARRGFVLLRQEAGQWNEAVSRSVGEKNKATGDARRWSQAIAEDVLRSGRARIVLDAGCDTDLRGSKSVMALHLRSVLCVPLRQGLDTLGVLYVDHEQVEGRFGPTEQELLVALASQAALALVQQERDSRQQKMIEESTTELQRMRTRVEAQNRKLEWKYSYAKILGGESPAMQKVFALLDRVTPTQVPVLIQGESGTGKELVAQAIHYNGPRRAGPFISVNCGALTPSLLESELFGHKKGAFTGAESDREGLMVLANGGTLFLDEIGDMPIDLQAKLLRVLQEGEVRPLGSDRLVKVDFRLLSATNRVLAEAVKQGEFREDLYYRLNVVEIHLPPLRDRGPDLPIMVDALWTELARRNQVKEPKLTARARDLLIAYGWPGNVRELMNTLEGMIVLRRGKRVDVGDLPEPIRKGGTAAGELPPLEDAREEFTKGYLRRLLQQCGGNVSKAARHAGVHRRSLYRMLERYELLSDAEEAE